MLSSPVVFFTNVHYDGAPVVLVDLSKISKTELRELITESWRIKAPASVRKKFDQGNA